MCGSLRHESITHVIGNRVKVWNLLTLKPGYAVWSGFATHEKLTSFWKSQSNFVPVMIACDSFFEQGHEFNTRTQILGIGLKKDVFIRKQLIGKAGTIKLVTRPTFTQAEAKIHSRWPIALRADSSIFEMLNTFSKKDLNMLNIQIFSSKQLEMNL